MAIIVGRRISNISNSTTVSTATTGFVVHTFSTPGVTTFQTIGTGIVDAFLVGGGGAAGTPNNSGGGGGGGSTLYVKSIQLIGGVSYTASVGSTGGTTTLTYSGGSISAIGGGAGANFGVGAISVPGGSAGGGGENGPGTAPVGAGVIGLGFPGGFGNGLDGGGGGGAGGAGNPMNVNNGQGGAGIPFNITGVSTFYGGGGNGSSPSALLPPTSFPTMFGLGGSASLPTPANPGCIIIRYIG